MSGERLQGERNNQCKRLQVMCLVEASMQEMIKESIWRSQTRNTTTFCRVLGVIIRTLVLCLVSLGGHGSELMRLKQDFSRMNSLKFIKDYLLSG